MWQAHLLKLHHGLYMIYLQEWKRSDVCVLNRGRLCWAQEGCRMDVAWASDGCRTGVGRVSDRRRIGVG